MVPQWQCLQCLLVNSAWLSVSTTLCAGNLSKHASPALPVFADVVHHIVAAADLQAIIASKAASYIVHGFSTFAPNQGCSVR
jgi:hypothetical protein